MDAFALARRNMVDGQLRTNDVTDPRLIAAFQDIPRERFVPSDKVPLAYLDCDLEVGPGRYLLKPLVLAKLIEIATVRPGDRALDIACATGYSTAVLARLAAQVIAVEEEPSLAQAARANLSALKAANARVHDGALAQGAPQHGPFDVIVINGAVEFVPDSLSAQLAEGGRLVCVVRQGPVGRGMLFQASAGHVSGRSVFDSAAPLLPGFQRAAAFVF
ncbi:MAG TPA: protein-L-isoaspartate O-methyltransferase [Xanthobacteraceae bacterium]|nr:protein-L-isoaspartate O-methyltransferase [Xanthobacteraceae bacterium]